MPRIGAVALFTLAVSARPAGASAARCPLEVEQTGLTLERVRRVGGGEVPAEVDAYWRDASISLRGLPDGATLEITPQGEATDAIDFVVP